MPKTLPLTEVKAKLSELVGDVADQQDRIVVTRNGRPAAVLISPDDLDSLEETVAILSDPELLARVRQGLAEAEAGQGRPLDELLAERRREAE
jgi:antitoxin YefM